MTSSRPTSRRPLVIWAGVILSVFAIVAVTIVVMTNARHDPRGTAATAARTQADWELRAAVSGAGAQLSLGAATGKAVDDTCRATRPASQDYSITCERRQFRVYAAVAGVRDARSLADSLAPSWQRQDTFCDADLKVSTACLRGSDVDLEIFVLPDTSGARPFARGVVDTYVESDLWNLEVPPSSIVLVTSSTYYVG